MTVVDKMESLARRYHEGQTRKDGKTPYVVHPEAVVARLRSWGVSEANGEDDVVSLSVAWGHDLLEDTPISEDEILSLGELGERILAGIKELTFVRHGETWDVRVRGPRNPAKARYIEAVGVSAAPEILLVKIADRLCNAQDFVKIYRYEKAQSYARAGGPLFAGTTRIREELRSAVDEDIRKTTGEIDRIVAEDDAWECLSGGAGFSPRDGLVGFVRAAYDRHAVETGAVSMDAHCRDVVHQLCLWGCDDECSDEDGISIAVARSHALRGQGVFEESDWIKALGNRADRVLAAMEFFRRPERVDDESLDEYFGKLEQWYCEVGMEAAPEALLAVLVDVICHVRSFLEGHSQASAARCFKAAHPLLMSSCRVVARFREKVRESIVEIFERLYLHADRRACIDEIENAGTVSRLREIADGLEIGFDSRGNVKACRDWVFGALDGWGFDRIRDLPTYCAASLRHSPRLTDILIPSLASLCGGYAPNVEAALRAFEEFDSTEDKHLADWRLCDTIDVGTLAVEIADRIWWLRHALETKGNDKAFVTLSYLELDFLYAFLDRFEDDVRTKIRLDMQRVEREVFACLGVVWSEADERNERDHLMALRVTADMLGDGDCDDREIMRVGKALQDMKLEGMHYSDCEARRRADSLSPVEMDRAYCFGLRVSSELKIGLLRGDLHIEGKTMRERAESILRYEANGIGEISCRQDREWARWFAANHS